MEFWIIIGIAVLASKGVGMMLQKRFKEFSQIPTSSGLSGKEVAEKMLRDNGINDVSVIHVKGALTDHYNPEKKTVNLSEWVYAQRNVAAAAVAAHECGHAVQHAKAYSFLTMRSKMVPAVSLSAKYLNIVLMGGILLMAFSGNAMLLLVGIILFAITTLFSLVTLPVEFDASNRALAWLDSAGITRQAEQEKAKNALWWAAMTYVVAALASLAQLLYFVSIFLRRD